MEITPYSATGITPPAPTLSAGNSDRKISSDFETFLKMLTAQMQNQDPLNPIDSTDYATQLATFSGVEQQVKTNDLLSALGQQLGTMGLSQLAGWVGMEARVAAPVFFDGQPITLYPKVATTADTATLVVTNHSGQEVSRQEIARDGAAIDWAGTGDNGQPMPPGIYNFSVESHGNGGLISTKAAESYARVTEAKYSDGKMIVVLAGGIEVPTDGIAGLREPGA